MAHLGCIISECFTSLHSSFQQVKLCSEEGIHKGKTYQSIYNFFNFSKLVSHDKILEDSKYYFKGEID